MSRPKAARWLDLIAFLLQHRYPVTREQIFSAVADYDGTEDAARRKFERDKVELRELGIEIRTVGLPDAEGDEPASGYQLAARDFYLPYLELSDQPAATDRPYPSLYRVKVNREDVHRLDRATQLIANHDSFHLAAAAASARRKLGFDLPLSLEAVERVLAAPASGESAAALEVLQRAVAARSAVKCRYFAIGRDEESERVIEPWGLFFSWGRWYCVAFARERAARRVFRVDRMSAAALLKGADAQFTVPGDFTIRDYVGRSPWELSEAPAMTVRVRLGFPESRWVMSQGLGSVVTPVLEDGGAVLQFEVRDRNPFLRWLLTFGDKAEVQDPPNVATELAELRGKVAALYARRGK